MVSKQPNHTNRTSSVQKNYAVRAGRKLGPVTFASPAAPHSGDRRTPSRSHAAASSNQRPSPSRARPGTSSICTGESPSSGTRSASTPACRATACPRSIFASRSKGGCGCGGDLRRCDSGCERSDHERQRHRPSDGGSAPEPTPRPCRNASKGSVRKHRSRG